MSRYVAFFVGLAVSLWLPFFARGDDKPAVIKGWGTVIDPSGDCTIREDGGTVAVTAPAGLHDLWKGQKDEAKRFNAPRVMREVEGDFVARVKVSTDSRPGTGADDVAALRQMTGIEATNPYQGEGLLVWDSEQQYVRLERNLILHPKGMSLTTPWHEQGGKRVNEVKFSKGEFFTGRSTWLKVERAGQKITTSISPDGKEWTETAVLTTEFPNKVQVGISAVNVSHHDLVVEFEGFKILKE